MLKLIDYYGVFFGFTIYKNSQHKSILGGVLTILTCCFALALLITFGATIYNKTNPLVIAQTLDLDSYPHYNLTNQDFPIAFKFENEFRNNVNMDGVLYTYIQLIHQQLNSTTGNVVTVGNTFMPYYECNDDLIPTLA